MRKIALALMFIAGTTPAFAHVGHGETSALAAGLMHPFSGLDHMLAMIAVGVWAGLRGGKAVWIWPLSFVAAMIFGGALGMAGFELPLVEQGILASVLLLGLVLALGLRAPMSAGIALISLGGLFHGFAHGAEAPVTGGGALYAAGFVLATALLHACGSLTVLTHARPFLARIAGVAVMAGGTYLVFAGA